MRFTLTPLTIFTIACLASEVVGGVISRKVLPLRQRPRRQTLVQVRQTIIKINTQINIIINKRDDEISSQSAARQIDPYKNLDNSLTSLGNLWDDAFSSGDSTPYTSATDPDYMADKAELQQIADLWKELNDNIAAHEGPGRIIPGYGNELKATLGLLKSDIKDIDSGFQSLLPPSDAQNFDSIFDELISSFDAPINDLA